MCSALPSGRVTSVGGSVGVIGGQTGSVSQVVNYNTGQASLFGSGGVQVGWNGGASAFASEGFVWKMALDTDYSGPFSNVSGGSSEGPGGQIYWASNGVKGVSFSMSGSLLPTATVSYSYTRLHSHSIWGLSLQTRGAQTSAWTSCFTELTRCANS